jgi:Domain of unknown function (DUF4136)
LIQKLTIAAHKPCTFGNGDDQNLMESIQFLRRSLLSCLAIVSLLLTGCAATLRADVTSFQSWPANAAGSSFSFKRTGQQAGSLEHQAYEDLARAQLQQLGLKTVAAGATARFAVSLDYGVSTKTVTTTQPLWDNFSVWHDPFFYPSWGTRPGYWSPHPYAYHYPYAYPYFFGPRVIGYTTVNREVSQRRLRLEIAEGATKVYEATATSSGANALLSVTMPYLMRSIFEGFPGNNGQTRTLVFDIDKGQVKSNRVIQPN